jgi:hypothetical protein
MAAEIVMIFYYGEIKQKVESGWSLPQAGFAEGTSQVKVLIVSIW